METQKTTSKASLLNMTIMRAWRERWSDPDFGINIKKVLPRGVSGDVYNLADCILQQALIGSNANSLILNYLKYALCAHLVSHAAVLRRISKFEHYKRVFCVTSLIEFLNEIIDGVNCRHKPEEALLPGALLSLANWLVHIWLMIVKSYEVKKELNRNEKLIVEYTTTLLEKIGTNPFVMGMLLVGRHEDTVLHNTIIETYTNVKNSLTQSNFTFENPNTELYLKKIVYSDVQHMEMPLIEPPATVESITYCIQPLLAVEILLNPCHDTAYYVNELQMIQRLKHFSNARLFYEIIRAVFISLSNVVETSHDTMWGAFTFFKVPDIIKQLNANNSVSNDATAQPSDHIPDVVKAFEMLLEDNLLLDFMDTKCTCNIIEYLLNDWKKQSLVNEMHVKLLSARRENTSLLLQNRETTNQAPSIINFIIRAELPLSGILKTLSADYNKVQESLLAVLCQVLVGNSFELILSVATVEGRLKTFVARLIQCNENSKQVPGEVGKPSVIRSTLFDVSFLMLTIIVQIYGSEVVLSENGDSFFEKWVRECMVERNKPKCPKSMIAQCDENVVDELLLSLSKPEAQLKNSNLTWQDICMNLPAVLYHVLIAWEKETLSSADVKGILDNIKRRLFAFSVCATSFLCAYMNTNEFLKPLNMIQQFLAPPTGDEMSTQENVKERLGLSFQIIRKMQNDVHPTMSNPKTRTMTLTQNLVSHQPLIEQFQEVWQTIAEHGWVPARAAQLLESLLHAGGPSWLTAQLVEEIIKCKYTKDMSKTTDIVFAVLHLNIERSTEALLQNVVPHMVCNRQGEDVNEPQLLAVARLCVNCIISAIEAHHQTTTPPSHPKKRLRSQDGDGDTEMSNTAKIRKVASENTENSPCSNDFLSDPNMLHKKEPGHDNAEATPTQLKEPLQSSVQHLFQVFQQFLSGDEVSPKIYFVYQFISLLVECGQERVRPVLRLLPVQLIQNLLKVMQTDDLSVGLLCRLHDLHMNTGRQAAISDLCLWRNILLRKTSTPI